MPRPDLTTMNRFPDLEKPERGRINQLFRLFILTTRGDILTRGATYLKRLALGTSGKVLHSDGTDVEWATLLASEVEVEELSGATYDDVQNFINFFGDRTILDGGTITAHGDADGKVVIAACKAWCKVTDSGTAIGKFFDFAGKASQTLTDLQANFVYLHYNAGTPQVVVATTLLTYGQKLDHILLGVVFRNGTATHIHNTDPIGISGVGRSNLHWLEHFLVHRVAGAVTSSTGTRQLVVTTGVVYAGLSRIDTNAFNTSTGDTFSYWYYDGDAGPAVWVEVTGQTAISNTQYNNTATGLVNLSAAAKRGVHWVYLDNDGVHLHVVYGQKDYSTAEAELATPPTTVPALVSNYCVLIAKIIVQKDQSTLFISYPWTEAFQTSLATDHGSLAGLLDDDHTQYVKESEFTAAEDILVGTGSGTLVKATPAEVLAILSSEAGATFNFNAQNVGNIGHIGLGNNAAETTYGIIYYEDTPALTNNAYWYGHWSGLDGHKTSAPYTGVFLGAHFEAGITDANTQPWSSTIGLVGVRGYVRLDSGVASSSLIAGAASFYAQAYVGGAVDDMVLTNLYGLYIPATILIGNSKLTNRYGIYIENQAGGATLNYAIFTNAGLVHFGDNVDIATGKTFSLDGLLTTAESELTLDTDGAITVTQMRHKVDTFEGAASDDLVTINGGGTVNLIILRAEADARTIVVKHGSDNIWLQGKADISLDDLEDGIMLAWDSTNSKWFDIAAGGGGLSSPLSADLDFAEYKAIALVCDNGATIPAAPTKGQWFLHTPTGRNVLMMYDGSNWVNIISIGAMTVYVDATDGSDAMDKGTGVDSDAFATMQYAVDQIPGLVGGNVIVYINAETYSETITILGKQVINDYTIKLQGTLTTDEAAQSPSAVTTTTLTDAGQFTGDSYTGFLCRFTKAAEDDVNIIIKSHTNDILTFAGQIPSTVDTTWDYAVYHWGTILQGVNATLKSNVVVYARNIELYQLDLTSQNTSCFDLYVEEGALVSSLDSCTFRNTYYGLLCYGTVFIYGCHMQKQDTKYCVYISNGNGYVEINRSWFRGQGDKSGSVAMIQAAQNGYVFPKTSLISMGNYGVFATQGAIVAFASGAASLCYVENCTTGIYVTLNAVSNKATNQNFANNTADTASATGGQVT